MKIEKVIVTWENIQNVAEQVVKATQRHYGDRLLSFSDKYLENTIHPWIDWYIHENYLFSGDPSKADLDDFVAIEMKNGN